MIKRMRVTSKDDIPEDWKDHVLVLWEEDDVNYSDKEYTNHAFIRITGRTPLEVDRRDLGDSFVYFYRDGWVKVVTFDGGWVGVLVGDQ